jgi:hypothetical protein
MRQVNAAATRAAALRAVDREDWWPRIAVIRDITIMRITA